MSFFPDHFFLLVKCVSIDGISQAFVFFRFVDIIVITVHDRFWNVGQANCIFKILWKYDDWSFRFHHFLENGRFYRENTCKCSPLVNKMADYFAPLIPVFTLCMSIIVEGIILRLRLWCLMPLSTIF